MMTKVRLPVVLVALWIAFIVFSLTVIWAEYFCGLEYLGNSIAGTMFLLIVGFFIPMEYSE